MKRISLAVVVVALMVLGGCNEGQKAPEPAAKSNLPPQLSGVWKQIHVDGEGGNQWAMVITEDGRVSEVLIELGAAIVKPGEVTKEEMRDGQFSTFDTGPAYTNYNPKTREFTVAFELKHFQLRMGNEVVEGSAKYAFTGPVAEDWNTWNTTFAEEFDYGPRFPMDPNAVGVPKYFRKEPLPAGK
jgi:hypothetical protein